MRNESNQRQTLSRQDLYDAVWAKPMREVSRDLGVSDVGLAKLCRRHAIPTPERGYWSKLRHGKSVLRIPAKSDSHSGPKPDTRSGRCRTVGAKRRWVEPYLVGFLSAVKLDRVFRIDSPASLMR